MLKRLKRALVESYVGAIGLGFVFAYAINQFAFIFITPATNWANRDLYYGTGQLKASQIIFRSGLPYMAGSVVLLIVGYLLLRWLYYTPAETTNE